MIVKSELINRYRIVYKDEGRGAAIMFIPGADADCRSFAPQIAALASSYRVIAPSLRHYYPKRVERQGSIFQSSSAPPMSATLVRMLTWERSIFRLVTWWRGRDGIAKAHAIWCERS